MYKIMLIIALIFFSGCNSRTPTKSTMIKASDNSSMKQLKNDLDAYTQATIDNDIPKLINFIYPKVFTVVPKTKMTQVLTEAYKSGNAPKVTNIKHLNINPIETYKEGMFSIITSSMSTTLKSPMPDNVKFEAYMLERIKKGLNGKGTVEFDKDQHTFAIKHVSKTLAINENNRWKFAGIKQARKYAKKGLLAKALIDAIQKEKN